MYDKNSVHMQYFSMSKLLDKHVPFLKTTEGTHSDPSES